MQIRKIEAVNNDILPVHTPVIDVKSVLIELYIEFLNDYLTIEKYASDKGLTVKQAQDIIEIGRNLYKEV